MIHLEWHLDRRIVKPLARRLVVPFHKLHVHPLFVTSLNIIITGLRIMAIATYSYVLAIFLLYVSWLLDEVDGSLARKYNQTTVLGKYLDSGNDLAAFLLIPAVILLIIFQTWQSYHYNFTLVMVGCLIIIVSVIEQQRIIAMDRMGIRIVRDIVLMTIFHTRVAI
ncbi:MAG: CDP-alcohol phosphatidyltransferase family protein [Cyclobacteriaceae bacterium]